MLSFHLHIWVGPTVSLHVWLHRVHLICSGCSFVYQICHTGEWVISFSKDLLDNLLSFTCLERVILISITVFVRFILICQVTWRDVWPNRVVMHVVECMLSFQGVKGVWILRKLMLKRVHSYHVWTLITLTHVVSDHHPIFFAEGNITEMCSDATLLQFNFQSFTKCLLSIHLLDCFFCRLRIIIAYKAVAFGSSRLFVCHDSNTDDSAEFEWLEEVEEIKITPLIWKMEDEEVCTNRSLLVLTLGYQVDGDAVCGLRWGIVSSVAFVRLILPLIVAVILCWSSCWRLCDLHLHLLSLLLLESLNSFLAFSRVEPFH